MATVMVMVVVRDEEYLSMVSVVFAYRGMKRSSKQAVNMIIIGGTAIWQCGPL